VYIHRKRERERERERGRERERVFHKYKFHLKEGKEKSWTMFYPPHDPGCLSSFWFATCQ
jgi:hypothetical protein